MEKTIKKIFQKHIKEGGIISSPDKLASMIAATIKKRRAVRSTTEKIMLWCVNGEFYYQTREEAVRYMDQGDSLSKVWYEWTSSKEMICSLLNDDPALADEEEVINYYVG